jgi:hypothetical protein
VPLLLSNRCFTLSPGLAAVILVSVRSINGVTHAGPALHLTEDEEDDEEDVEEDEDRDVEKEDEEDEEDDDGASDNDGDGDVDGDASGSVQRVLLGLGESRASLLPLPPGLP